MRARAIGAALIAGAAIGTFVVSNAARAQSVDAILEAEAERIERRQQRQEQIDQIASEMRRFFDERQRVLKDLEGIQIHNRMMQARVDDQNRTLADLRSSIDRVTEVERQILPLMTRMIAGLERFIENDVPFLLDERLANVERLRSLLDRADVTAASQFRNVLEAWQIEMTDYGQQSETYTGEIDVVDGTMRQVDFLRIGRVAFMYVTPDDRIAAAWNKETESWERLPESYVTPIRTAIDVLEGEITPRMFTIPVLPPEEG